MRGPGPWHPLLSWPLALALGACGAGPQKHLLFEQRVRVPDGRFVGPIEIDVPRRADHRDRDFEIHAELTTRCTPLLRLSFPDGEVSSIGAQDQGWQELQARRAQGEDRAPPAAPPGAPAPAPPRPEPPRPGTGHWQAVTTESWPGQVRFLDERARRCGAEHRYRRSYLNAYDESGRVTIWAEIPQEIDDAELVIRVYEIVEDEPEPPPPGARAEVKVKTGGQARPPKPVPPRPPPKREQPAPAEDPAATWVPGEWVYEPGGGKWVWHAGYYQAPARTPGPRAENTGSPPVVGCTWASGYWTWEARPGRWRWTPGHWNAPPPRVEQPGPPPVPESPWVPGYWIEARGSFEWVPGHWGKPAPRAETPPPPPYPGAHWVSGTWISKDGSWVWSPGFYERSDRPPPRVKAETPPPQPAPGAVWLAGFWRWNDARADYDWVAGHWELPPGEGYVWIADPPPTPGAASTSGHWELKVKVNVDVNGTVKVRP